jgi:hypothetical protein
VSSKILLADQLASTAQAIEWAVGLVPAARQFEVPPHPKHPKVTPGFKTYFGEWSAARLLYHLLHYEEQYALPTMKHWLGGEHPPADLITPDSEAEAQAWAQAMEAGTPFDSLLELFRAVRGEQIGLVQSIPEAAREQERVDTEFGRVSAAYAVTKTIQHTFEHGDAILRNALYWDRTLEWLDRRDE